jgi:hypothetical protein
MNFKSWYFCVAPEDVLSPILALLCCLLVCTYLYMCQIQNHLLSPTRLLLFAGMQVWSGLIQVY